MKNKLVAIGFVSEYSVFLNVSVDEALRRISEKSGKSVEYIKSNFSVEEYEFDDYFHAYDVSEGNGDESSFVY